MLSLKPNLNFIGLLTLPVPLSIQQITNIAKFNRLDAWLCYICRCFVVRWPLWKSKNSLPHNAVSYQTKWPKP